MHPSSSSKPRRIAAYVVLALGLCVMVATSAPHWTFDKTVQIELASEGRGDDKLVRLTLRGSGPLLRSGSPRLRVTATADRPASDVRLTWLGATLQGGDAAVPQDADAGATDAGAPGAIVNDATYAEGFTVLRTEYEDYEQSCPEPAGCELVYELLVGSESADPFALTLSFEVWLSGLSEHQPKGSVEAELEVLDAP